MGLYVSLFKVQDANRVKHNQFVGLPHAVADFPDDRTGAKFGPVDSWGRNKCLAMDGFTGSGPIAMSLVVGNKLLKSQQEWGIAQDSIESSFAKSPMDAKCHFALTAHVKREIDQAPADECARQRILERVR
jgi:hypothetical protein